jgi:hypothetical protein
VDRAKRSREFPSDFETSGNPNKIGFFSSSDIDDSLYCYYNSKVCIPEIIM